MRPFVALLAPLLLLPGCLGPDEGETPPDGGEECPPEANCVIPTAATAAPPGASTPGAANATRETKVPFSYEGSTGTAACPPLAPTGLSHCVSLQASRGEAPEVSVPTPRRLVATLTGDANPAGQDFSVSLLVDVGEGWTWGPAREPSAQGPSPLSVDWDLSAYPAGTKFMFYVESFRAVGPVALVLDRAYSVEGELSGLAPA